MLACCCGSQVSLTIKASSSMVKWSEISPFSVLRRTESPAHDADVSIMTGTSHKRIRYDVHTDKEEHARSMALLGVIMQVNPIYGTWKLL